MFQELARQLSEVTVIILTFFYFKISGKGWNRTRILLVMFALGSQNHTSVGSFKRNKSLITCYFGAEGLDVLQSFIVTIASFDNLLTDRAHLKFIFAFIVVGLNVSSEMRYPVDMAGNFCSSLQS
jgi:hypothetical protein